VPLDGEMPIPASMDLACVGLGATPKAPLLSRIVGPSRASGVGGEGLPTLLLFYFCYLF